MEKYDIFISYRRKDAGDKAEHLKDLLEPHYKKRISFDRENLTGKFNVQLIERIDSVKDFILVIGKNSFCYTEKDCSKESVSLYNELTDASQEDFAKRIDQLGPDADIDYVRVEVGRALKRRDINIVLVIPEFSNDFDFSIINLPSDISQIRNHKVVTYSDSPDALFRDILPKVRSHLNTKEDSIISRIMSFFSTNEKTSLVDSYLPKRIHYDIFVSYRRVDGREYARNIELALKAQGYKNVFFDYNSIQKGEFTKRIIDAIYSCNDFILVLSPKSMKRCVKNGDPVANEIRTAQKYNKNIIPVTIDGKLPNWPRKFPKDLELIKDVQFHDLKTDSYFDDSIEALCLRLITKKEK